MNRNKAVVNCHQGFRLPRTGSLPDDVTEDESEAKDDDKDEGLQGQALGARETFSTPRLSSGSIEVFIFDVDVVGIGGFPPGHRLARDVSSSWYTAKVGGKKGENIYWQLLSRSLLSLPHSLSLTYTKL